MREKDAIENHIFVEDMVQLLSCVIDGEGAKRGIRALCRHFGGQMIYIPMNKFEGAAAQKIFCVLTDEVGDADAEKILEKLMALYGRMQVYIPLERCGFRKDIALEIYERYDGTQEKMNELCREYNITFAQVYNFIHRAKDIKRQEREKKQIELFG
jgi:Mor family transcriptional regulator